MLQSTYTVIPKQISEYRSNSILTDIYIYACIKHSTDSKLSTDKHLISRYNIDTLSNRYNIPIATLKRSIHRLDCKLLDIISKEYSTKDREQYYNGNIPNSYKGSVNKNYYYFDRNPTNYYLIDNSFFELDIPIKVKGLLLLIKSICKNDTNKYISSKPYNGKLNISELSDRIGMDRKTLDKYIKEAVSLKQIKYIDKGIYLLNDSFLFSVLDNRLNQIYNIITKFCLSKDRIPPDYDKYLIHQIYYHYPKSEQELQGIECLNKEQVINQYSLSYQLSNRCNTLPNNVTLQYFLKVLNINITKHQPSKYTIIL